MRDDERRSRPPRWNPIVRSYVDAWSLGLAAAALTLWFITVHRANFSNMRLLGLVTVLGWTYFVGLSLVVVSFVMALFRTPLRTSRLIVALVVLVVFIYGTAAAIEPTSALTDSWIHAGFTQYIVQHGHVLNNYDARFSWPGGFSLAAVLVAFAGQPNALAMLRWFPVVIELLYLAPLLVIATRSGVSRRGAFLGVALFYATNWIYQDYFSPQALNYLFFLVVIASVFACWRPRQRVGITRRDARVRSLLQQGRDVVTFHRLDGHDAERLRDVGTTLWILVLLIPILGASVMSHQLTPYALIVALGGLLVTRRLGRPELVIIAALFAVGWLSLGASNYWIGHLNDIFGGIGQISSTVGSNVTNRVTGSASHRLIVQWRMGIIVMLYLFAVVGSLRRAADSRSLEVLVGAPFVLLAIQNYGGEGLLRVVLFALPFSALLAASALLPRRRAALRRNHVASRHRTGHRIVAASSVGVVLLAFSLGTTVVRGGNDAYEAFSLGELAAVNYTYTHSHSGQTIGVVSAYLPLGQRELGAVDFYIADGPSTPSPRTVLESFLKKRPHWIILSRSQESWGEIVAGYQRGWIKTLQASLVKDGYRVAVRWPTASVLELVGAR
ncbi:MAG: hypothetical protein ACYC19_01235 [Acidimicrobiales bacterium]